MDCSYTINGTGVRSFYVVTKGLIRFIYRVSTAQNLAVFLYITPIYLPETGNDKENGNG